MQHNIPTGDYNDVAAVVKDPQVQAREMLVQCAHAGRPVR